MPLLPIQQAHGKANGGNVSDSEARRELGEIEDKIGGLFNALQGYKSSRDGALIEQARRQVRSLFKRRVAILAKIRKQGVSSWE